LIFRGEELEEKSMKYEDWSSEIEIRREHNEDE
jgi:hypothetical protein